MTLIEFMHFLWWIGILQRIPLANGNEFFLDEYEEIKPITSKFIRSPNYGDVSMLQTYIDFTKLWKFVTPEGYMLKITFLHIGLCPPVNETFTGECSSGIFVYDGKEAHDKALSMELYGQDWATQPIFFSSGNFLSVAYVASFTAVHNHYAGFLAVVESVNVLPLPYTLLQCNETILINEDQILHFSNNNFLQPYGQQYGCTVQSKIQLQSNWKGYSELTFLSLSIDPGYVSQQHGCQFKLNISYHEAEHGQLAYAQFCGHSPPKAVFKFIISFSIHLQIGNGLSQQGFSVAVRLKYCPPEMVWDSSYCSNHCNLSCQDIKNQNIIGKKQITCPQSCYNDCRCPEYKPFWDLNRCVAVDECINTEEILKPENTKFESKYQYPTSETGEDFDKDSIPVVKTLSRKRRSSVYIFCKDKTDKPGFCSLQRALGHCSWHAIMDKCVRTCDKCGQSERWDIWSAWSTCSRDCDGGKQLRAQSCVGCESMRYETKDCSTQPCTLDSENQSNDYSNDNMAPSLRSYWRADNTTLLPKSRQYTGSGFGNERDNKEFKCGANEFLCTNRKCIPITKKCNGYYECTDHSDEPGTCLLGHRLDGRRCIINWATHKCIDTNETAISATIDEDVAPWAFRRCPGQQSPELERYWWTYNIFGNLKHLQSNRCLHCNVSDTNFTVLLKPCDIFDPHQQWICVGLHVRLKYPHRVLPRTHYHQHWLAMSVEGPGKYMEMVEQRGPKTTEFHILETDKLSICSGRGGGYVLPSFCTKTCGNGTIRVLRSCAKYGQDCNGGDKYEYVPCNTKPCPFFCPPSWSVMKSENNTEDVNCFKAFNTPKTYKEAQAFCAANNWTLAADKNKQTHKFILNLQSGVVKSYIGVYEDLAEPADGPPSHALRYDYDRQPIGGFQPWRSYGVTDHEDLLGCILGRGGAYYGSKSSAEGFQCDKWGAASDHFQQLTQLVPSYYEVTRRNNLCRNPNLDPSGLWCYTKNDKKLKHRFCSLPDCLDTPSEDDDEKAFPEIDSQHIFLIRSRLGGYWSRKWCLAAPPPGNSKDYAKPLPCDLNNEFQQFFWWSSTSLVNRATLKCLTLEKGPPEHGGRLVFASCDRRKSHSLQAWNSVRSLLLSGWKPDGGTFGTQHRLYKVVYDKINQKVYLSDMRHSLFVARSEKIGMVRMSTLFSRAPVGTYVFIQGCGGCLTNDVRKGFDLTYVGPCSQEHLSQRWVILGNGRLMNSESGKCLASFIMQAYAITVHCDDDDISQKWKWKAAIGVDLKTVKTTTLMHVNTQFYLSCGCAGLSSTCLLPTNQGANLTWLFLPHASKNTPAARINSETRATSRGVLGYSFVLQSSANLTKCAIPQVKPSKSGENAESENKIVFLPCKLEDTGFLWWFSGLTTQIKHRGLDLCLDADLKENDNDFEESEIQLRPCSISRLDFQSWIFTPGPNQQDPNELPGEYIHLASNNSYMMSIKLLQNSYNQEDFVLVLQVENNKDKWEALTLSGNKVGISEMIDCALPWAKMSLYKGDRSWTRYGYRCQPWNSQMPHRHPFDPKSYSEPYLTANKCRRPRGKPTDILDKKFEDHVWCMTLKPDVRWQDCLVSRCPLPAVVSLTTASETWEVSLGEEALPFTCQTPGECYYDVGESFSGYTNYTSREYCMNWRKYHNGDRSFPDHARCRNPNRSFMKPWCYVRKNVPQYCDTIKQCVVRCKSPFHKLHKMKIASISYLSPSHMYAAGSKIQVVCKEGYRIKPFNAQEQVIQCQLDGTWKPALRECRRITCPNPVQPSNARLLTVRSRYLFGSKVAYQCREGHLIAVGQTTIEITCLGTGEWSDTPYKCLPACPEGWISFNMSCYTTKSHHKNYNSYKDANDECGKNEGGGLAVPTDKITYDMIKWLVQKNVGQADFLYWLGIKDVAASQIALQAREWKSQSSSLLNIEVFRDDLLNYHQFQIRSYGSAIKREERFAYTDRCMYGDRATRKVYTKSCSFENATGLHWSWITYDHLYNVDLGLCLTAMAYDGSNGEEGVLTGSVRLENCSFGAENQSFTCGPHSGYLLKLRKEESSFIAIAEDDPDGEVVVGGKHATGPRALWHSYPDATYLCHWVIKPPDTYFIVHRDRSPSFTSFTAHELHKCIQNRTGAKLVSRSEITTVGLTVEKLNWCACLYMLNDQDEVISAASVQDDACALPDDVSYVTSPGITLCKTKPIGDSLCNREDGSSPSQKPVPNWCLTLSVTSRVTSKVEPRFCSTPIAGHVCHAKARWSCTFPFQPPNSIPFMESGNFNNMAFSYGSKIPIRCKKGYRFPGDYSTVTIKCNEFLKWELIKTMRDDEIKYYVSDRKERERALYNLACKIITCSTPPEIPGMSLEVNSNTRGLFNYGTNATYTCLPGTHFAPGDNQHTVTCSHDKTWQKTLSKEKKCVSMVCDQPADIEHADLFVTALVFTSPAVYTCKHGYWFQRNQKTLKAVCNGKAVWEPNPQNASCVPVTCITPSDAVLSKIIAEQAPPKQLMNIFKSKLIIRCLPGYWFDREVFTAEFNCGATGKWEPFPPNKLQCVPVYCRRPEPVPGAILYGSDAQAGRHVRYQCAPTYWIRRAFKLFSPHWGLCLRVVGGADPLFFTPLNRYVEGSSPMMVTLNPDCNGFATSRDLWVWHWSFHIRNRFTDTCLTATALPTLKEDAALVTVEKCDRNNVYQHWRCSLAKDGSNARLLSLRIAKRGAYLTTIADEHAFWSGKGDVQLVVTGDNSATGVESYWQVYGIDFDSVVDICMLREGHVYEEAVCNSYGRWMPDPYLLECTLVDCGPPPEIPGAISELERSNFSDYLPSHFAAPNIWEHSASSYAMKNYSFPVFTISSYQCNVGKWVIKHKYSLSMICRENGLWQERNSEKFITDANSVDTDLSCTDVVCPAPKVLPLSVALVTPTSMQKYSDGEPVLSYQGYVVYAAGVNQTYRPVYNSSVLVKCDPGYWILNENLTNVPAFSRNAGLNGSTSIHATCDANGNWSELVVHKMIECVPVTCSDPGNVQTARRFPESVRDPIYGYGTIFQYQCNSGFWFSPARIYTEIKCNESGLWHPDPKMLACIEVRCSDPGPVNFAKRSGNDFSVQGQVIFTCGTGRLIGRKVKSLTSICQPDGFWFPPPSSIRCKLLICDPLPIIPHGTFSNSSKVRRHEFIAGDETILSCDDSYTIDSSSSSIKYFCDLNGAWYPDPAILIDGRPRCEPVHCPSPPDILSSGAIQRGAADTYRHGDEVRYVCPLGKLIEASVPQLAKQTVCVTERNLNPLINSGQSYKIYWDPAVSTINCTDLLCSRPGLIEHSTVTVRGFEYLAKTSYVCHTGYMLNSTFASKFQTSFQAVCQYDALWFPNPALVQCVPVECADPGDIRDSTRFKDSRLSPPYYFNDVVTYKCIQGKHFVYLNENSKSSRGQWLWKIKCLFDGTWDMLPSNAYVTCQDITCRAPRFIPKAYIATSYREFVAPSHYPLHSVYNITCSLGYVSSSTGLQHTSLTCGKYGQWEPVVPSSMSCERIHCHDPGNRNHSTRVVHGFQLNDRITYFADDGYASLGFPVGDPRSIVTLECGITGEWHVHDFANLSSEGDYTPRAKRDVPLFRTPYSILNLTETHITFDVAKCAHPKVSNNITEPSHIVAEYDVGSVLYLSCIPLHFVTINITTFSIMCTKRGEWWPLPSNMKCLPASEFYCNLPIPPANATIELDSYRLEETATITCLAGFEIRPGISKELIMCKKDHVWSPKDGVNCSQIVCDPPPDINNAELEQSGTVYGSMAFYKCQPGYSFTQLANDTTFTSVCLAMNTWSPSPFGLSCQPVNCGTPDDLVLPNTISLNYNSTLYASVANFTCQDGFVMESSNGTVSTSITAWCGIDGHWTLSRSGMMNSSALPDEGSYCEIGSCDNPPNVENAHVTLIGGTNHNASALYRCAQGYRVDPPGERSKNKTFVAKCGVDGNWTTSLTSSNEEYKCVKAKCPHLQNQPNAYIAYTNDDINNNYAGGTASHSCNDGYTTVMGRSFTLRCMWYGEWEPPQDSTPCVRLQCSAAPEMENAIGAGDDAAGGSWTYTCDSGYEISSTESSVTMECSGQALWVPHYTLLQKCRRVSCPSPDLYPKNAEAYMEDGTKIDPRRDDYYIEADTIVQFKCILGFWTKSMQIQSQNVTCQVTRTYSPQLVNLDDCEPLSCSNPPQITGATLSNTNSGTYFYNSTARYTCPPGTYFPSEKKKSVEIHCNEFGVFEPNPASLSCEIVNCDDYMMPNADRITLTSLAENGQATYRCHSGAWYERGVQERTYVCNDDGRWEPDITNINCKTIICNVTQTGYTTLQNGEQVNAGESLYVRCKGGYYLVGPGTINCQNDGTFAKDPSTLCKPVECPDPPIPNNADASSTEFEYGNPIVITCSTGYWLSRGTLSLTLNCLGSGRWDDDSSKMVCVPVSCLLPPAPKHGAVDGDGTKYKAKISVKCDEGFWLDDASKALSADVVCESDGEWSRKIPEACSKIVCPNPPSLPHSKVTEDQKTGYKAITYYICMSLRWVAYNNKTHWVLSSEKEGKSTCSETGDWDPMPDEDFRCNSIYDGDLLINGALTKSPSGKSYTGDQGGPPYYKLIRRIPAEWLKFDEEIMTLSDAYFPPNKSSISDQRDIKFIWDQNPLTFWIAPSAVNEISSNDSGSFWSVEVHLGKPRAVFGIMIMCADDGRSDLTSFSLVFAGRDKKSKTIGPFKVYGDTGISGVPQSDFPLNFSSVATAWIYTGLAEEMLWFHLVIDGTVVPGVRPSIREIGLYASDAVWEWSYPVDTTPVLLLCTILLSMFAVMMPVMYYFDTLSASRTIFTPSVDSFVAKKSAYKVTFSVTGKKTSNICKHILFCVNTADETCTPVSWIRGNELQDFGRRKRGHYSIVLPFYRSIKMNKAEVKFIAWSVSEDTHVGYSRLDDTSLKQKPEIEVQDVKVVRIPTGERWHADSTDSFIRRNTKSVPLSSKKVCLVGVTKIKQHPVWEKRVMKLIQCHQIFALVCPPFSSKLNKIERFLIIMAITTCGIVATFTLQVYLNAFPSVEGSLMNDKISEQIDIRSMLGGNSTFALLALFGALASIPVPVIIRLLYAFEEYHGKRMKTIHNALRKFCSHKVFYLSSMIRLPFMKTLRIPLATFLGVTLRDKPMFDAATVVSGDFAHRNIFLSDRAEIKRRWSLPLLPHTSKLGRSFHHERDNSKTSLSFLDLDLSRYSFHESISNDSFIEKSAEAVQTQTSGETSLSSSALSISTVKENIIRKTPQNNGSSRNANLVSEADFASEDDSFEIENAFTDLSIKTTATDCVADLPELPSHLTLSTYSSYSGMTLEAQESKEILLPQFQNIAKPKIPLLGVKTLPESNKIVKKVLGQDSKVSSPGQINAIIPRKQENLRVIDNSYPKPDFYFGNNKEVEKVSGLKQKALQPDVTDTSFLPRNKALHMDSLVEKVANVPQSTSDKSDSSIRKFQKVFPPKQSTSSKLHHLKKYDTHSHSLQQTTLQPDVTDTPFSPSNKTVHKEMTTDKVTNVPHCTSGSSDSSERNFQKVFPPKQSTSSKFQHLMKYDTNSHSLLQKALQPEVIDTTSLPTNKALHIEMSAEKIDNISQSTSETSDSSMRKFQKVFPPRKQSTYSKFKHSEEYDSSSRSSFPKEVPLHADQKLLSHIKQGNTNDVPVVSNLSLIPEHLFVSDQSNEDLTKIKTASLPQSSHSYSSAECRKPYLGSSSLSSCLGTQGDLGIKSHVAQSTLPQRLASSNQEVGKHDELPTKHIFSSVQSKAKFNTVAKDQNIPQELKSNSSSSYSSTESVKVLSLSSSSYVFDDPVSSGKSTSNISAEIQPPTASNHHSVQSSSHLEEEESYHTAPLFNMNNSESSSAYNKSLTESISLFRIQDDSEHAYIAPLDKYASSSSSSGVMHHVVQSPPQELASSNQELSKHDRLPTKHIFVSVQSKTKFHTVAQEQEVFQDFSSYPSTETFEDLTLPSSSNILHDTVSSEKSSSIIPTEKQLPAISHHHSVQSARQLEEEESCYSYHTATQFNVKNSESSYTCNISLGESDIFDDVTLQSNLSEYFEEDNGLENTHSAMESEASIKESLQNTFADASSHTSLLPDTNEVHISTGQHLQYSSSIESTQVKDITFATKDREVKERLACTRQTDSALALDYEPLVYDFPKHIAVSVYSKQDNNLSSSTSLYPSTSLDEVVIDVLKNQDYLTQVQETPIMDTDATVITMEPNNEPSYENFPLQQVQQSPSITSLMSDIFRVKVRNIAEFVQQSFKPRSEQNSIPIPSAGFFSFKKKPVEAESMLSYGSTSSSNTGTRFIGAGSSNTRIIGQGLSVSTENSASTIRNSSKTSSEISALLQASKIAGSSKHLNNYQSSFGESTAGVDSAYRGASSKFDSVEPSLYSKETGISAGSESLKVVENSANFETHVQLSSMIDEGSQESIGNAESCGGSTSLMEYNSSNSFHHAVVTHEPAEKNLCPGYLSLRSLLSWFIACLIIALCVCLFFLGQNLSTNSKAEVYKAAATSVGFSILLVMIVDAFVGMQFFQEDKISIQ